MAELTLLYDGGCPLCMREVDSLRKLDNGRQRVVFVDIDDPTYEPSHHANISYRQAMGRIHAIQADGTIIRDMEVFRRAYVLVGRGWLYAPTGWPLLRSIADWAYGLWARLRLSITGRPQLDQLCEGRCQLMATSTAQGPGQAFREDESA